MRLLVVATLLLATPCGALRAQSCAAVGAERWSVKTAAPLDSGVRRALTTAELAALRPPAEIGERGEKLLDSRYADEVAPGLHEGDLVSVTGWVQLIKLSPDDCDYHIQITPTPDGISGTVIVEIPDGDAARIHDPSLRRALAAERALIRQQLHLAHEPSRHGNVIGGRAYLEFTGALFFDGPHFPHCDARGVGARAATCWEVHPVLRSRFVPRPAARSAGP